jgi:hypothetical protein
MLIALALAVLTLSGQITVWEIYASPSRAAWSRRSTACAARARLPDGRAGDLPNAVALSSSLGTIARILGPAIGARSSPSPGPASRSGSTRSATSRSSCLLALDTARLVRTARTPRRACSAGPTRSGRASQRGSAGVAFGAVFLLSSLCFNFNVLLPLVADQTLHSGAQVFGLIAAVFGAGALCGAMINATVAKASLRLLLIGAAGFGLFELLLAPMSRCCRPCACSSSRPA